MAKKTPWGKIVLGTAAVLVVGYGIVQATKKEEPKPKSKKELDIPPGPGPDDIPEPGEVPGEPGIGEVPGYHRLPLPDFEVPLPQTVQDHVAFDQKLCEGYWSFDVFQGRDPSDAAMGALQIMVPEVTWPSVPGDHVSLQQLEQLARYRADQIAYSDPNKPAHENFAEFCGVQPKKISPPGEGLAPAGG